MPALGTHKICKITSLTADSYIQLFVLITMLLTVLSVQQSAFAMAAPLLEPQSQSQLQPQPQEQQHNLPPQPHHHHHHPYHHRLDDRAAPQYYRPDDHQLRPHIRPHPEVQLKLLLDTNDYNNQQEHMPATSSAAQERLHKRQVRWHVFYAQTMDSTKVEWYNPCGGEYVDEEPTTKRSAKKPNVKKTLRILQRALVHLHDTLKSDSPKVINTQNTSIWDHNENYNFLPRMENTSGVYLRRWYRDIQIFVASFDYLQRAQLHRDYHKDMDMSNTTRELNRLRINAREMLCDLEIAINKTTLPAKAKASIQSLFIPRKRMESMLHFLTNIKHISPLNWNQMRYEREVYDVNEVDLKLAKARYITYLRKLIRYLRKTTKSPGPIALGPKGAHRKRAKNHRTAKRKHKKISKNKH